MDDIHLEIQVAPPGLLQNAQPNDKSLHHLVGHHQWSSVARWKWWVPESVVCPVIISGQAVAQSKWWFHHPNWSFVPLDMVKVTVSILVIVSSYEMSIQTQYRDHEIESHISQTYRWILWVSVVVCSSERCAVVICQGPFTKICALQYFTEVMGGEVGGAKHQTTSGTGSCNALKSLR